MTTDSVSLVRASASVTAAAKFAPASGAAVVTSLSVSDGVFKASLPSGESEPSVMLAWAPSESNPIPSQNPPGSADCGAALDDKAAPLFSLEANSSFCGSVESRHSLIQGRPEVGTNFPLGEAGAGIAPGPQNSNDDGIPKILQRDSNNETYGEGRMNKAERKSDESDSDAGCLLLFAIVCISIAVGHIFREAYGWLTFGCIILLIALRRP